MELLEKYFDMAFEIPDGIKKLRELILTLAMQGKLVPQDPNDQAASELLKEIEVEKKNLVKERKIKVQKPLSPIKAEDIPYDLPNSWVWVKLFNIIDLISGQHLKPNEYNKDHHGYPYYTGPANFGSKYPIPSRWTCVEKSIAIIGDILITVKGAGVGKTNILKDKKAAISRQLMALRPIIVNQQFLLLFIKTIFSELQNLSVGIAIPGISREDVLNQLIPLPPLAEQKCIVAKIDELMALCDILESQRNKRNQKRLAVHTAAIDRLLSASDKENFDVSWRFITEHFNELCSVPENVAELKKAILQLAVMGKLVPQDPNEQPASELLKEIEVEKKSLIKEGKIKVQKPLPPIKVEDMPYHLPESWEWVRLGEIAIYNGRSNANISQISPDTWVLDLEDIEKDTSKVKRKTKYIDRQSKSTKSNFCKGDVLYGKLRPYLNKVIIADQDGVCTTEIVPIVPFKSLDSNFLKILLKRPAFIEYVNSMSYGVKMPRLGTSDAINSLHVLPPLAEQKRIVAKIDELMALCNKLEQQITSTTEKQTAIFDAVLAKI